MTSDSILDHGLFVRLDLDHSLRANSFFQINAANRAHIANQLLLYDSIIIPTIDFGIIPTLINWFGQKNFEEALDVSALKFIRRTGILGYIGNGTGLTPFTIFPPDNKEFDWWQHAIFGKDSATSVDLQLKFMCPSIIKKQRLKLIDKIVSLSTPLTYTTETFMKNIVHESYTDIMGNEELSRFIQIKAEKSDGGINLTKLSRVDANRLIVLGQEGHINDSIDLVLRIAEINMEIVMATAAGNVDIYASTGSEKVLTNKLARCNIDKALVEGFVSLLELNNVPDIGQAIISGDIELSNIWSLRQKKLSNKFRGWLREADPQSSRELEKAYVHALTKDTLADSLPLKTIRFAITSAAGINPVIGLVAGVVDSFFVDKWLSGYSPKLLFDDLLKLFDKNIKQ